MNPRRVPETNPTFRLTGVTQVLSALQHGVCTLHTSHKESAGVRVDGWFSVGSKVLCVA